MIKIVDGNLFDSDANFILHQTNCQDYKNYMNNDIAKQVLELYPHVEREYNRYIHHCNKNKLPILGTAQYVPVDHWALIMVDTIKNNNVIAYDSKYQYIVNIFGQSDFDTDGKMYTNLKALKNAMIDVKKKAQAIGASIALPYGIGNVRGSASWDDVYKIIKDVFGNSELDIEIRRFSRVNEDE